MVFSETPATAAISCADFPIPKQEQDTSYLVGRIRDEYARIDALARARDAGSSEPGIVDTCGILDGGGHPGTRRLYGAGWLS